MTETHFDADLEGGWQLEGKDGRFEPVHLALGDTEIRRAPLGLTVGRHPKLCERVVEDPTVSRRHFRIGYAAAGPFIEDLNSLNGTTVDGALLTPFQPVTLKAGQTIVAGKVTLTVCRLASGLGEQGTGEA